jgi:hypothetical protein
MPCARHIQQRTPESNTEPTHSQTRPLAQRPPSAARPIFQTIEPASRPGSATIPLPFQGVGVRKRASKGVSHPPSGCLCDRARGGCQPHHTSQPTSPKVPQQTPNPDAHSGLSHPSPFRGFPAKHAVRTALPAANPRIGHGTNAFPNQPRPLGAASGSGRPREHRIRPAGAYATEPAEDAHPNGERDPAGACATEPAEDAHPNGERDPAGAYATEPAEDAHPNGLGNT